MASVDVAIPCYQYGCFLRECGGSVLKQDVEQLRVLIIDNASTDDSAEVARQLAREDRRVDVVVHATNLGPHASYNEAVDWAQADYFLLLDADDLLASGCLARAIDIMERDPGVVFACGSDVPMQPDQTFIADCEDGASGDDWQVVSGRQFLESFCRFPVNVVGASTVVRRTTAQKTAGYYNPKLRHGDEVELWLRLAVLGDVARTSKVQAIRRFHTQQRSVEIQEDTLMDILEREAVIASFFSREESRIPGWEHLRAMAMSQLEAHAYWSSLSHFARGYHRQSRALMKFATRSSKYGVRLPPVSFALRHKRFLGRAGEVLSQFRLHQPRRSAVTHHEPSPH